MIGKAYAVRYESLAKLGEVLPDVPKAIGTRGQLRSAGPGRGKKTGGIKLDPPVSSAATLKKLGISKRTANLARTLATLRPTELNAVLARDKTLAQVPGSGGDHPAVQVDR